MGDYKQKTKNVSINLKFFYFLQKVCNYFYLYESIALFMFLLDILIILVKIKLRYRALKLKPLLIILNLTSV